MLDETPPVIYQPAQAETRLEVSPSTLRRWVADYETVFGELKKENGARVYSGEVLERLEAAKQIREQGAASLKVALEAVAQGAERPSAQPPAQVGERSEQLDELITEIRALTQALDRVGGHIRVLDNKLEEGRPPSRAPDTAPWWQFWKR